MAGSTLECLLTDSETLPVALGRIADVVFTVVFKRPKCEAWIHHSLSQR